MKFEQEYRRAHQETVGETDCEFDLLNYVEWLESLVEERFKSTNTKNIPCPSCGGNTHGSLTCEKCGDGIDW